MFDFSECINILGKMSSIISATYEIAQNYAFDEEEGNLEIEFISQQEFEETFTEQVENPIGYCVNDIRNIVLDRLPQLEELQNNMDENNEHG